MSLRVPELGPVVGVVVTFESDAAFPARCRAMLAECDALVIVDNGSSRATRDMLRPLTAGAEAVQLIENDANLGLGRAQNQGIAAARARGAGWVLLLDDDSRPEPGLLSAFAAAFSAAPECHRIGLLAPQILQQQGAIETRYWVKRGRWGVARRPLADATGADLLFAIASGSLVRMAALDDVGDMREGFFIDYIDVEFGLRLDRGGWRIHLVPGARLQHRLGNPRRHALLGQTIKTSNHAPARRYTIFRNRAHLWRAYGLQRPGWAAADGAAAIFDLLRILLLEQDKRAKLCRAVTGLWHGLGRYSPRSDQRSDLGE